MPLHAMPSNLSRELRLPGIHRPQPNPSQRLFLPPQLLHPSHDLHTIHTLDLLPLIQNPFLMILTLRLGHHNHIPPLSITLLAPLDNGQTR